MFFNRLARLDIAETCPCAERTPGVSKEHVTWPSCRLSRGKHACIHIEPLAAALNWRNSYRRFASSQPIATLWKPRRLSYPTPVPSTGVLIRNAANCLDICPRLYSCSHPCHSHVTATLHTPDRGPAPAVIARTDPLPCRSRSCVGTRARVAPDSGSWQGCVAAPAPRAMPAATTTPAKLSWLSRCRLPAGAVQLAVPASSRRELAGQGPRSVRLHLHRARPGPLRFPGISRNRGAATVSCNTVALRRLAHVDAR